MALNESQISILVSKRIGATAASNLKWQTLIPAALNNLAYATVADPDKRKDLVTDKESITGTIVTSAGESYVDLSTLVSINGLMLDKLQFGTIFYYLTHTFTSGDVNTNPTNTITLPAHGFSTGDAVVFTTTVTLPSPFVAGTVYYVIAVGANVIQLATTKSNALLGTAINITTTGSGVMSITTTATNILQWLGSPNQGGLTSCLPINFVQGWLVNTKLYLNNATAGLLKFASPFVPTLENLPVILEQDLVDTVVELALTGSPALPNPSPEN